MLERPIQAIELVEQRDRFVSFAFAVADMVVVSDDAGTVQFAAGSAQALLGSQPDALLGTALESLFAERDWALVPDLLERLRTSRRVSDQRFFLRETRGRCVPALVSGMRDARGTGAFYLVLRRDLGRTGDTPSVATLTSPLVGAEFTAMAGSLARQTVAAGATAKLALYQMPLTEIAAVHGAATSQHLEGELVRSMRAWSVRSETVGEAGPGRYGVLLDEQTDPAALETRLQQVALEHGMCLTIDHRALRIDDVLDTDSLETVLQQAMGRFEHQGLRALDGVALANLVPARRLGGSRVLR